MKSALGFFLVFVALVFGTEVEAAAASASRVKLSGQTYIRLTDYAKANKLTVRWLSPNKTVQLSDSRVKLVFTVDPQKDRTKVQVNGIEVSLSFAMYYSKGTAYIAQLDTTHTLAPILSPPKNSRSKIDTICIDPGHGGKDPGFRIGSKNEKNYTLLLSGEVREMLQQAGFKVVMTRTTDKYLDRSERTEIAKKGKADLFVSLHFNAFTKSPAVRGIEVYCLTPAGAYSSNARGQGNTSWVAGNRYNDESMLLAYQVQKSLVQSLKANDRGVKRARFEVLRDAPMPAVLVEGGFMSNPTEGKNIFSSVYRRKMARAIVDGIIDYKKAVGG